MRPEKTKVDAEMLQTDSSYWMRQGAVAMAATVATRKSSGPWWTDWLPDGKWDSTHVGGGTARTIRIIGRCGRVCKPVLALRSLPYAVTIGLRLGDCR